VGLRSLASLQLRHHIPCATVRPTRFAATPHIARRAAPNRALLHRDDKNVIRGVRIPSARGRGSINRCSTANIVPPRVLKCQNSAMGQALLAFDEVDEVANPGHPRDETAYGGNFEGQRPATGRQSVEVKRSGSDWRLAPRAYRPAISPQGRDAMSRQRFAVAMVTETIKSGQRCPHCAPGPQTGHPPGTVEGMTGHWLTAVMGKRRKKLTALSGLLAGEGNKYAGRKTASPSPGAQEGKGSKKCSQARLWAERG
jgi:hypothetical protein